MAGVSIGAVLGSTARVGEVLTIVWPEGAVVGTRAAVGDAGVSIGAEGSGEALGSVTEGSVVTTFRALPKFWKNPKYQPLIAAATINTAPAIIRPIRLLDCLAARAARRVFGDGTSSHFAISATLCGRRTGFLAKHRATTSSHVASIGSPSISSSLRRCVMDGGIFSRI